MPKLKNCALCAIVLIVAAFILKSCFEKKNLCGSNEGDILRRACDIELKKVDHNLTATMP